MNEINYLGLDISKNKLDLAGPNIKHHTFENNNKGITQLIKFLSSLNPSSYLVLEASGGYERSLILALKETSITICKVDPYQVRSFARSMGKVAKTDKIDALILAQFGKERQPRPIRPYDEKQETLRALYDRRQHLGTLKIQESNRLETALPSMIPHLKKSLGFINKQIKEIESQIKNFIASSQSIKEKVERLISVRGVGLQTATVLLAHMPELGRISDKEAVALVGVAPYNKDSGKYSGYRSIRGGRFQIRKVLYMAALTATSCNPILRAFYQRLISNGKKPKVALVAVMRKLIMLLNKIIKNPNFVLAH